MYPHGDSSGRKTHIFWQVTLCHFGG